MPWGSPPAPATSYGSFRMPSALQFQPWVLVRLMACSRHVVATSLSRAISLSLHELSAMYLQSEGGGKLERE